MTIEEWLPVGGVRLLRFAYLLTGDRQLAEDLVQDVLTDAVRKWERIQLADDVDAYLRKALVHRYRSWFRVRTRRALLQSAQVQHDGQAGRVDVDTSLSIAVACTQLPRRQRIAVVLRYYEDMSFAQIASALECSEGTARSLVHRALRQLKPIVQQIVEDH